MTHPKKLALCFALLCAPSAFAQDAIEAANAANTAPTEVLLMNTATAVPLGEIVEDCIDDNLKRYYITHLQRFGTPESVDDTIVVYRRKTGTVLVAMYGSADTTDDAKKRLESRKKALDFAVKVCAKALEIETKELYSHFEMTYTRNDRKAGKTFPLIRWHRGRWELL